MSGWNERVKSDPLKATFYFALAISFGVLSFRDLMGKSDGKWVDVLCGVYFAAELLFWCLKTSEQIREIIVRLERIEERLNAN